MLIVIEPKDSWTLSVVEIPKESPVGVISNSTERLVYEGRTYDRLLGTIDKWIDIESGDIAEICWRFY